MPKSDHPTEAYLRIRIGKRLRRARQEKGLYLKDVAAMDPRNFAMSRIVSYEQGTRSMPLALGKALAKALGVSPAWLMCMDDRAGFSPEQVELLAAYDAASPDVRDLVRRMLAAFKPPEPTGE